MKPLQPCCCHCGSSHSTPILILYLLNLLLGVCIDLPWDQRERVILTNGFVFCGYSISVHDKNACKMGYVCNSIHFKGKDVRTPTQFSGIQLPCWWVHWNLNALGFGNKTVVYNWWFFVLFLFLLLLLLFLPIGVPGKKEDKIKREAIVTWRSIFWFINNKLIKIRYLNPRDWWFSFLRYML